MKCPNFGIIRRMTQVTRERKNRLLELEEETKLGCRNLEKILFLDYGVTKAER